MNDIKVMFIDDEINILKSLERNLIHEPYQRFFANSGAEALEMMDKDSAHVVVTDMRMPGMDGLTFLNKIKEKYPETVRMVLSGQSDTQQILGSINAGEVYRYITKPISETIEFHATIRQAIQYYMLRRDRQNLIEQLSQRNQELEESMARVHLLEGLLPICANCKNVRDDKGYWQQIEHYVSSHSEAVFTHGICPDCVALLYPEYCQSRSLKPNKK
ncbi:MAG: response regulator [Deltaproteobacteria bacterium]|nr:response regulator [Deltaproteobacteria bacterium]